MATYTNEDLGLSFDVPDKVPVKVQLRFRRAIANGIRSDDTYAIYWQGSLHLIENWQCEHVDDPDELDLDTETRSIVTDIVFWTCNQVADHMLLLDKMPKNS